MSLRVLIVLIDITVIKSVRFSRVFMVTELVVSETHCMYLLQDKTSGVI